MNKLINGAGAKQFTRPALSLHGCRHRKKVSSAPYQSKPDELLIAS